MGSHSPALIFSFRILRKPAFLNALFLLKEFQNGPKQRKTGNGGEAAPERTFNKHGTYGANQSYKKENPPKACAEIVFSLDDHWMEETDDEEGTESDEKAFKVHCALFSLHLPYPELPLSCVACEVCVPFCPMRLFQGLGSHG